MPKITAARLARRQPRSDPSTLSAGTRCIASSRSTRRPARRARSWTTARRVLRLPSGPGSRDPDEAVPADVSDGKVSSGYSRYADGWSHLYLDGATGQVKNQDQGAWAVRVDHVVDAPADLFHRERHAERGSGSVFLPPSDQLRRHGPVGLRRRTAPRHLVAGLPVLRGQLLARGRAAGHRTAPSGRPIARGDARERRRGGSVRDRLARARKSSARRDATTRRHQGIIVRPSSFDPSRTGHRDDLRRPARSSSCRRRSTPRPAPRGSWARWTWALAELEFIVVQIDEHEPPNRSKAI